VVGFQTRGIIGHTPRTSIEDIAAENVRYLRSHQATGPYVLAGYSGGALTAFEMARQLMAQGETVTNLFIFDTFAPGFAKNFRPQVRLGFVQRLRCEWDLLREEGVALFFERARSFLQSRLPRGRLMRWLQPTMHRMRVVEDAWRAAAAAYEGGSYRGIVTLLKVRPRALRSRLAYEQDPMLGWSRVVETSRLSTLHAPGDHLRMIEGKNAETVADLLEERLRGAG
jgi:thioesterase domain-containing protein